MRQWNTWNSCFFGKYVSTVAIFFREALYRISLCNRFRVRLANNLKNWKHYKHGLKINITHLVFRRFRCAFNSQCDNFLDDSTKKTTKPCSFLYHWKFILADIISLFISCCVEVISLEDDAKFCENINSLSGIIFTTAGYKRNDEFRIFNSSSSYWQIYCSQVHIELSNYFNWKKDNFIVGIFMDNVTNNTRNYFHCCIKPW